LRLKNPTWLDIPNTNGAYHLQNDLLCVKWDVKPYTLTHSNGAEKLAKLFF